MAERLNTLMLAKLRSELFQGRLNLVTLNTVD